jgi:uncharacterized membrane protein
MSQHPEPTHSRMQFQIDRITFFSDAVIAIALTLMILEIKIPELGEHTSLSQIIDKYEKSFLFHALALFLGFFSIGNIWMQHHKLFEHIIKYNDRLIRINLYFLFTVMLLPISISFLFTNDEPQYLKYLFYITNLFLCNFSYSLMLIIIYSKKNNFSILKNETEINIIQRRSLLSSLVYFIAVVLLLFRADWWYFIFFAFPASRLIILMRKGILEMAKPAGG